VLCLCSVVIVIVASIAFLKNPEADTAIFGFVSLLLVSIPGILNFIKYAPDPFGYIAGVLDLIGGTGSAFCQFLVTDLNWGKPVGQARAVAQT